MYVGISFPYYCSLSLSHSLSLTLSLSSSLPPSLPPLPPSPLSLSLPPPPPPSLSQGCSTYEGQILTTTQCFLPMPLSPWKMSGKHCCSLTLITVAHPGPASLAHPSITLILTPFRLYIDSTQLTTDVRQHLSVSNEGGVCVFPYESVSTHLSQLAREGRVWVSGQASHALCSLVPMPNRKDALSPLQLLKAVKNETEIKGMKNAHVCVLMTSTEMFDNRNCFSLDT